MLILQRKPGESLLIGENIEVAVVAIDNNRVKLAISAPNSVSILRSELVATTDVNKEAAAEESAPQELLNLLGGVLGKPE